MRDASCAHRGEEGEVTDADVGEGDGATDARLVDRATRERDADSLREDVLRESAAVEAVWARRAEHVRFADLGACEAGDR